MVWRVRSKRHSGINSSTEGCELILTHIRASCSLFALAHASFSIQFNLFASNKIPVWLRVCRYARKYVWLGYAIKTIFSCMTQKWIIRWCYARFFVVVSSVYRAARLWRMQILAAKQFFTIIWTDRTISMTMMSKKNKWKTKDIQNEGNGRNSAQTWQQC